ncbi:hypothetical protein ELI48_02300 [Rhizobium ruizarguesonis]|uniref:hypothetical protein n=1 Tax=Rhizobium ruizarguesonis TaxID=2081791 RepID=UPI0010326E99|nr:hypothetical protein [Rhizobium ruizarguesonis]TAU25112.1 hypothetical protein ELI48_02300 [Rhizobium ruizarguesonis]TAW08508.1 hypothetical protein ELI26_02290 [Rhizobium ruizarguesonis]
MVFVLFMKQRLVRAEIVSRTKPIIFADGFYSAVRSEMVENMRAFLARMLLFGEHKTQGTLAWDLPANIRDIWVLLYFRIMCYTGFMGFTMFQKSLISLGFLVSNL